eukprot:scaffold71756_cov36-Phaeocystis_antarctica.AAC.2
MVRPFCPGGPPSPTIYEARQIGVDLAHTSRQAALCRPRWPAPHRPRWPRRLALPVAKGR